MESHNKIQQKIIQYFSKMWKYNFICNAYPSMTGFQIYPCMAPGEQKIYCDINEYTHHSIKTEMTPKLW